MEEYILRFTVEEVEEAEVFGEKVLIVRGKNHRGIPEAFHIPLSTPVLDIKGNICILSPGNIERIYQKTEIVRIRVLKGFTGADQDTKTGRQRRRGGTSNSPYFVR